MTNEKIFELARNFGIGADGKGMFSNGDVTRFVIAILEAASEPDANAGDLRLLKEKAACCDEWHSKTEWVQEQLSTFPFRTLGRHRADVMREEIERLRAITTSAAGEVEVQAARYRFLRSMVYMTDDEKDGVSEAMYSVFPPDKEGLPTEAEFDASIDAGMNTPAANGAGGQA